MVYSVILVFHLIVVLLLVVFVLLQRSGQNEVSGLSSGIGVPSGRSSSGIKPMGFLARLTAVMAGLFMVTSLLLNMAEAKKTKEQSLFLNDELSQKKSENDASKEVSPIEDGVPAAQSPIRDVADTNMGDGTMPFSAPDDDATNKALD